MDKEGQGCSFDVGPVVRINLDMVFDHLNNLWVTFTLLYRLRGLSSILSPMPCFYAKLNFINLKWVPSVYSSTHFLFIINLSEKTCLTSPMWAETLLAHWSLWATHIIELTVPSCNHWFTSLSVLSSSELHDNEDLLYSFVIQCLAHTWLL